MNQRIFSLFALFALPLAAFLFTFSTSAVSAEECIIPDSGPWPACATGSNGTPPANSDCAPEYPDVCLPLWPDVNCSDITERNFRVVGWDRHDLDLDGDGIACETNEAGGSSAGNGAGQPCPASGAWPAGCVPGGSGNNSGGGSSSGSAAGQPCPASGAWPAGCIPNGGGSSSGSSNGGGASSGGNGTGQPCPATGAWPAGCIPNGGGSADNDTNNTTTGANLTIVSVDKKAEYVDLRNSGSNGVNLTGYVLVSERGNQRCNLHGWLDAGATIRIFAQSGSAGGMQTLNCNFSGPIWSNSSSDDAILLDPSGQEVARYDS